MGWRCRAKAKGEEIEKDMTACRGMMGGMGGDWRQG
jgi:hypothetical protein